MTFKLQQNYTCNRDHIANKAENIYLTPVVNHDCIKFSHTKLLLCYLLAVMQTNNQNIQITLINTKETLLCLHTPVLKLQQNPSSLRNCTFHHDHRSAKSEWSHNSCCAKLPSQRSPESKKKGVLSSMRTNCLLF